MPLTDLACRRARAEAKPLKLVDEKGLYLLVKSAGKYWRWDYRFGDKRKTMALGVYPEVSLAKARTDRDAGRKLLADNADPMAERKIDKLVRVTAAGNSFKSVAIDWHTGQSTRWAPITASKALKHMEADLFPAIGHRPVSEVTPPELLATLRRVESRGATYTATRLREICGQVFRFAIATGRATYNPAADLTGAIVPARVEHRPAITERRPFGQFLRDLREFQGADALTKLATRLALLTFVRSQELRYAKWDEVDAESRECRIPSGRMKMAKGSNQAHVVPLSAAAIQVLEELRALTGSSTSLFPNNYGGDGFMSENTIGRMLIRMGYQGRQTLHGFRATARSLLSERGWSVAALERQLDHSERSKVVAAYARSEHLDERRRMMDDWGGLVWSLEAQAGVPAIGQSADAPSVPSDIVAHGEPLDGREENDMAKEATPEAKDAIEFKEQAAQLVEGGEGSARIARGRAIDPPLPSHGAELERDGRLRGADSEPVSAEQMEISRLRAELARVTTERDILEKAMTYFAKQRA